MPTKAKKSKRKAVKVLTHDEATRKNIPTAEHQSAMQKKDRLPVSVSYKHRNRDLDPQLVWRSKDEQDWSDLVVNAPPLYIQEKVHPKVLIDDLINGSNIDIDPTQSQPDLFADFNGLPSDASKTDFYQHDANWSNRMILGDSLQVMASLAEREGLRGKVQCIYLDPPYGINFSSNWQWSTTSRTVTDGKADHITREPEQVKAFRDTWRDGIHSYLTFLRDRLIVARDLLKDTGSIFVQIGDENVHRVRVLLDEVFGDENFFSLISVKKLSPLGTRGMANVADYVIWYAKDKEQAKFRPLFLEKKPGSESRYNWVEKDIGIRERLTSSQEKMIDELPNSWRFFSQGGMLSAGYTPTCIYDFDFQGARIKASAKGWSWKTNREGMQRLIKADRLIRAGISPYLVAYHADNPVMAMNNMWLDSGSGSTSYEKIYVVQTSTRQIQKCILMATDPGDLVLDPTCGSGTTAYVAEQWGRRWITIDTSRVALALARGRIMGARYPYYLLADSEVGQRKEAEVTRTPPPSRPTHDDINQGFVYERVPHITLKSIVSNTEVDVIWDKFQTTLEPLRSQLNNALGQDWEEWEIPPKAEKEWPANAKRLHGQWREKRIDRQNEIDASIAAKADFKYLYDKPYHDKNIVRVAGPFTVESLSPHRVLSMDENDELVDSISDARIHYSNEVDFAQMILENLKTAGIQQAHKEDKIIFTSLIPWPGDLICAEGRYIEGSTRKGKAAKREKRAAIFIGPEYGTVSRSDLVAVARDARDADFDVLIACAFNYDAYSSDFNRQGNIPVLRARINADLHMSTDLKNTGKGNHFVIFGEPEIKILDAKNELVKVKINGVDVFHPQTGEVRSDGVDGIACWFIDTNYNEESFFVRHAYFLGSNDPYNALKKTLRAEINKDAWGTLNSDTSRPFPKPSSGRIAVKVINHLGDEVMKIFSVG